MVLVVQIGLLLLAQAAAPPTPGPALTGDLNATTCQPTRNPDDIIVCGRHSGVDGYRIPQRDGFDPAGTVESVARERQRLLDVGAAGTGSCSATGAGGWTGCDFIRWRQDDEQYAGRNHGHWPRASVHVGPLSPPPR